MSDENPLDSILPQNLTNEQKARAIGRTLADILGPTPFACSFAFDSQDGDGTDLCTVSNLDEEILPQFLKAALASFHSLQAKQAKQKGH